MVGKFKYLKTSKEYGFHSTSTFNSGTSPFTREITVWFGLFPLPVYYFTLIEVKTHVGITILLVKYGYEARSNTK